MSPPRRKSDRHPRRGQIGPIHRRRPRLNGPLPLRGPEFEPKAARFTAARPAILPELKVCLGSEVGLGFGRPYEFVFAPALPKLRINRDERPNFARYSIWCSITESDRAQRPMPQSFSRAKRSIHHRRNAETVIQHIEVIQFCRLTRE
jgi:hypothetical protein